MRTPVNWLVPTILQFRGGGEEREKHVRKGSHSARRYGNPLALAYIAQLITPSSVASSAGQASNVFSDMSPEENKTCAPRIPASPPQNYGVVWDEARTTGHICRQQL